MDQNLYQRLLFWLVREKSLLVLAALALVAVAGHEVFRKAPPPFSPHGEHAPIVKTPLLVVPHFFQEWRRSFLSHNQATDPLGLVRAIFIGDNAELKPATRELFARAGLAHLLTTNALKAWVVAVAFGGLGNLALFFGTGLFTGQNVLRLRRLVPPVSKLSGVWLYWLWSDQSVAITRSVFAVSAKFALEALELPVPFWRLLLAQFLTSLIISTRLWGEAGFRLTYGCIFGILLIPGCVRRFRPSRALPGAVWDYFWTTSGAALGMLPTTWWYFGEINFTGILTAWVFVPFVSFLILPLALVQMLLALPWKYTIEAHGLAALNGWCADVLYRALAFLFN